MHFFQRTSSLFYWFFSCLSVLKTIDFQIIYFLYFLRLLFLFLFCTLFIFIVLWLYWRHILTSTNVLIIYHSWIHPLHHSFIPLPPFL
jgi:hypothetical protein